MDNGDFNRDGVRDAVHRDTSSHSDDVSMSMPPPPPRRRRRQPGVQHPTSRRRPGRAMMMPQSRLRVNVRRDPHRHRRGVPASSSTTTATRATPAPALPVGVGAFFTPRPVPSPAVAQAQALAATQRVTGRKRRRQHSRKGVEGNVISNGCPPPTEAPTTTEKCGVHHYDSESAATTAAARVLASRFFAAAHAVERINCNSTTIHRTNSGGSATTTPATLRVAVDRRTRQLLLCVAPRPSQQAHTAVSHLQARIPALEFDKRTGVARVPMHMLGEIVFTLLPHSACTDASPDLKLVFTGPAATSLRTAASRLLVTRQQVAAVLAQPWKWPVLHTVAAKACEVGGGLKQRSCDDGGAASFRLLCVETYSEVHQVVVKRALDLVYHADAELLLRAMRGVVDVRQVAGRLCCRLQPGVAAAIAASTATDSPPCVLPEVDAVPSPHRVPVSTQPPAHFVAFKVKNEQSATVQASDRVGEVNPRPTKKARHTTAATTTTTTPIGGSPGIAPFPTPPLFRQQPLPSMYPHTTANATTLAAEQERLLAAAASAMRAAVVMGAQTSCYMGLPGLTRDHWHSSCPWTCLGLAQWRGVATVSMVRRRYHELALRLHPDKVRRQQQCSDDALLNTATKAFVAVQMAYKTIVNALRV